MKLSMTNWNDNAADDTLQTDRILKRVWCKHKDKLETTLVFFLPPSLTETFNSEKPI